MERTRLGSRRLMLAGGRLPVTAGLRRGLARYSLGGRMALALGG